MNTKANMVWAFLGGIAIGAFSTFGIMKKLGYEKQIAQSVSKEEVAEERQDFKPSEKRTPRLDETAATKDVPSFSLPEKMDTQRVRYHIPEKPELEEVSAKYADPSFDQHMAEREHPEDDEPDEEEALQQEIAEALMDHPGQMEDGDRSIETDGYGHVMMQLACEKKGMEIYLVHVDYAGEIYPLEDLRYFEKDDVLIDLFDTPVDDVDRTVGSALEHFGECGSGPDSVIVRNISTGFEYEITRETGSFAAYLYGVTDEESEFPSRTGLHPAKARKQKKDAEDEEE